MLPASPTVSVILPAYNAGKYVAEAVAGILAQTFVDFELIAIDDGSTDDTLAVLQSFDDPRLRVIQNQSNSGIAVTRNTGITDAKGRYLALQDADDISHPERLAIQVDFLENNKHIGVISASMKTFSGRPPPLNQLVINTDWHALYHTPKIVRTSLAFGGGGLSNSPAMFRSDIIKDNHIFYDASFPVGEDRDFYQRLSLLTDMAILRSQLVMCRKHDANTSPSNRKIFGWGSRATLKFWRNWLDLDTDGIVDDAGKIKGIDGFYQLEKCVEQVRKLARKERYDPSLMLLLSGKFVYSALRKLDKQGEKTKTICRAYRNSSIIASLPTKLKRTLRTKCFFCR